jgi:prepilin-type N-terminal cleavage/methylation domain-containing protein
MIDPIPAKQRQRGFSLAEVLVAVALMAVILLALFGLVSAGVRRAYSGKKMTEASVLAQHVLERSNVYEPQDILGGVDADPSVNQTWVKRGPADGDTLPAATGGATTPEIERDEIRKLLVNSDIPANTTFPATLSVTATPVPTGNFGTASMVRIVVDLTWFEWGTRRRQVRLQALNLRTTP